MKINYQYGLIIGRFQPPCLHHLAFINQVINSGVKELLIGIGDSDQIDSQNFLSAAEVNSLLTFNLNLLNFPYQLKIIPDIHNPPLYANHLKKYFPQINENNTCLFTDNNYTSDCFINYGHHYQVVIPKILPHRATEIRQLITKNNSDWQKLVPQNVLKYLIKYQKNNDRIY